MSGHAGGCLRAPADVLVQLLLQVNEAVVRRLRAGVSVKRGGQNVLSACIYIYICVCVCEKV
jgi:hypothetical protein